MSQNAKYFQALDDSIGDIQGKYREYVTDSRIRSEAVVEDISLSDLQIRVVADTTKASVATMRKYIADAAKMSTKKEMHEFLYRVLDELLSLLDMSRKMLLEAENVYAEVLDTFKIILRDLTLFKEYVHTVEEEKKIATDMWIDRTR